MSICMCGAEAGYPHEPTCPYPLYRATEAQEEQWHRVRANLVSAQLAARAMQQACAEIAEEKNELNAVYVAIRALDSTAFARQVVKNEPD